MRSRPAVVSSLASFTAAAALLLAAGDALAQGPTPLPPPPPPAPAAAPAAAPAPAPAPAKRAAIDPGYSPDDPVKIRPNCNLGSHADVPDGEARTAAELLCAELADRKAAAVPHQVRFGVLGGRTLVILEQQDADGAVVAERRTFLASLDEIAVAGPRIVDALVENKPIDETRNVDNVLAAETRTPKVQKGQMGFEGGIYGSTAVGAASGASAGVALGLLYRAGSVGISTQARFGGIGSSESQISGNSLEFGARYYLSTAEIAPYVGGGFEISSVHLTRTTGSDYAGSGFGAYVTMGAELLRTHHAAVSAAIQLDAPFYAVQSASYDSYDGSFSTLKETHDSRWVAPLSFNMNIIFR
jgi:hypothetical protein